MFYYLPWIFLMVASLAASVVLLIWGFQSGQFAEQDRARYLPLRDRPKQPPLDHPGRITGEVYALLGLVGGVGFVLAITVVTMVMRRYGG